jgi:CelD/BcsL family acetyltransferase involved in cellulose biosynthesis
MIELPLDDTRWSAYVSAQAEATCFHHPAWALLLSEAYSLRGAVLAIVDEGGQIVGGIPALRAPRLIDRTRRWVALPFTDALAPLVAPAQANQLARELDHWRIQQGFDRIELRAALSGARPQPMTAFTHMLALPADPDEAVRGFSNSVRRNIRTAERGGVRIVRIESEQELTSSYWRLHVDTRRRLGVMPQPRRLFHLLWERILSCDLGFALLAVQGSRPIAGAVFLSWNNTVIYKFSASDSSAWKLRPNDALVAEAIRIACLEHRGVLDFGRSDAEAEGLRRFKRGWGAKEVPLCYSVLGLDPPGGGGSERLVSSVVRRAPAWVARTGGRLLYRYAA